MIQPNDPVIRALREDLTELREALSTVGAGVQKAIQMIAQTNALALGDLNNRLSVIESTLGIEVEESEGQENPRQDPSE